MCRKKQIPGGVFDDGVVCEQRLLNKLAFYYCRSPRDINRKKGLLIFRFDFDFEKMFQIGNRADCQGSQS